MCLLFFIIGALCGYALWRYVNAPRLLDTEDECRHWQREWAKVKAENDLIKGLDE